MDTALPGLADEGHADLVRDALITLLTIMRPDWGSRQAVASRVKFAEQRLGRSLPQICLHAVTAAVTPGAPPDTYIRTTPADTLHHLAEPEHTKDTLAALRRRLLDRAREATSPGLRNSGTAISGENDLGVFAGREHYSSITMRTNQPIR
ncbi:hypothetical protein ACQEVF_58170 [Nonomuraea polychroma]|uniref:hypothetical protein n=1 Tax=Nonomuraea polychroma TaxID=46176 RepID=UPI003D934398